MIQTCAYAKINMFLEITGRRSDGYHTVDTIMQEVAIADEIRIQLLPKRDGIIIKTNIDTIPTDERNIAYKAAKLVLDKVNANCGAEIVINKNVPHEAGMGGGSSDGAVVLKGLNELLGSPLRIKELHGIAAMMGADVPFFLYGGTALMKGIGTEYVSALPTPELNLVVAKPVVGVSTPAAYKYLDQMYSMFESHQPVDSQHMINALSLGSVSEISKLLFNRFEYAVDAICPQTKALREFMKEHSHGALLSGSGAAIFAIADSQRHAEKLKNIISAEYPDYFVCVTQTI